MTASEYQRSLTKTNSDNHLIAMILIDILKKLEQIEERTPAD